MVKVLAGFSPLLRKAASIMHCEIPQLNDLFEVK
jgi:hypothetical protein